MWRKRLRFALALFVVVFAAVVAVSLRRGHRPSTPALKAPANLDPNVATQGGPGNYTNTKEGKVTFQLKFGNQKTYTDGRLVLGGGRRGTAGGRQPDQPGGPGPGGRARRRHRGDHRGAPHLRPPRRRHGLVLGVE